MGGGNLPGGCEGMAWEGRGGGEKKSCSSS